jgi:hypothetical protein
MFSPSHVIQSCGGQRPYLEGIIHGSSKYDDTRSSSWVVETVVIIFGHRILWVSYRWSAGWQVGYDAPAILYILKPRVGGKVFMDAEVELLTEVLLAASRYES